MFRVHFKWLTDLSSFFVPSNTSFSDGWMSAERLTIFSQSVLLGYLKGLVSFRVILILITILSSENENSENSFPSKKQWSSPSPLSLARPRTIVESSHLVLTQTFYEFKYDHDVRRNPHYFTKMNLVQGDKLYLCIRIELSNVTVAYF